MDAMDRIRARVADIISERASGTITLTRPTPGTPDDPAKPWVPGLPTTDTYALSARVDGVTADQLDGTTILATDLVVIASPKARHTMIGEEAADGAVVDIVPTTSDTLEIDGRKKAIKRVVAYPAAGPAALFHIFVAS